MKKLFALYLSIQIKTKYCYINYPIDDHSTPIDLVSFSSFIIKISNIIKNLNDGERLYLHCKGGLTGL